MLLINYIKSLYQNKYYNNRAWLSLYLLHCKTREILSKQMDLYKYEMEVQQISFLIFSRCFFS